MNTETYQFICKYCGKPYRGLVRYCPNCGKLLRVNSLNWEHSADDKTYTLPNDYPREGQERFDDVGFSMRD